MQDGRFVFLSYASVDRERVWPIVGALEAAGIPVWIDQRSIPAGAVYGPEIVAGIESCAAMLVCCSEASLASQHVRQEVRLAWSYERPYLPLMLERIRIPRDLEYWLANWQRVDILDRPPEQWLPPLIDSVRRFLGQPGDDSLSAPHLTAPARVASNLPVPATGMIGRKQELAALTTMLTRSDTRMLTLTGPGGIGKTRLALQAALEARDAFPDGVFLCDLSPISDPQAVVPQIASALLIEEKGAQSLRNALVVFLADKELLLVLDNFEQVIGAAPAIADLLAACPGPTFLATSRTPLKLSAEREFPLQPLPLPHGGSELPVEQLLDYDAVALFVQRAQAALPAFELSGENRQAVVGICQRLDGLPLAIELAAARIKVLSPQAIDARLNDRFALLTGGRVDAPDRHKTLRTTIDWSYDLLTPEEQAIMRRLSIFVDGWTVESADSVLSGLDSNGFDTFDGIAALVDHSLVAQRPGAGIEPRFGMLQTIRDFGLLQLEATGETVTMQHALASWAVALAEAAEPHLDGPEQIAWLDRLRDEHDNIRAALDYGKQKAPDYVPSLVLALRRFWQLRGYHREASRWFDIALDFDPPSAIRAKLLLARGVAIETGGNLDAADAYEQAIVLSVAVNDLATAAAAQMNLGSIWLARGQLEPAEAHYRESVELARRDGDRNVEAQALANLGLVAQYRGELDTAASAFETSRATFSALGNNAREAEMLLNLIAVIAPDPSQRERVDLLSNELLPLLKKLGDRESEAYAYTMLGIAADARADVATAAEFHRRSLDLFAEIDEPAGIATSTGNLGVVMLDLGDLDGAVRLCMESLKSVAALGDTDGIGFALEGLAFAFCAAGKLEAATRWLGAVEGIREFLGVPVPAESVRRNRRAVEQLNKELPAETRHMAWESGKTTEIETIVREALAASREFETSPA